MINTIKYYYNINLDDIKQIDDDYYSDNYILKYYYRTLNIELYNSLMTNNIYIHEIILNKNNEYITNINNKPYILLKVKRTEPINLDIIKKYHVVFNVHNIEPWSTLWMNKVDIYEKNAINVKDVKIKNSFNYFIGMTENAILLFNMLKLDHNYCLCHLRFNKDSDFFDPLNLVIDYKMRDYAEYIKKEFYYNDKYYYKYIDTLIQNNNYNDVMLFFIRMLFPSSFFDAYDNYIKGAKIDYSFYEKKERYEKYLKYIYRQIKKKYNIITIDWLK